MGSARYETRAAAISAPTGKTISGHAAVFNSEAIIAGEFRERIAPGAFSKTLRANDVLALLHHDTHRVLGRTSAGTLRLKEDARGLHFELDADATTPDGATAIGTVLRQDIRGCSFGFRVLHEDWQDKERGLPLRTLLEIDLFEVTLTATPAYEDTTATIVERVRNYTAAVSRLRMKASIDARIRGIA